MRVIDLDRDMSDVIPVGHSVDSEFLFRRMEEATLDALIAGPGRRILDSAAGLGQDDRKLAGVGAWAVGVEPSERMMALAKLQDAKSGPQLAGALLRVRAWSEVLPFRDGSFDAVFCKGALDHFDDPLRCVGEMARVTRPTGRVVLAVANFSSLGCVLARLADLRPGRADPQGRRHYDVPSDHFTRYDAQLLREQLERYIRIEEWVGVSLMWGVRTWNALLKRVSSTWADRLLSLADRVARCVPSLADVIIAAGPPVAGPGAGRPAPPAAPLGFASLRATLARRLLAGPGAART